MYFKDNFTFYVYDIRYRDIMYRLYPENVELQKLIARQTAAQRNISLTE